jgi:hypothetical protein
LIPSRSTKPVKFWRRKAPDISLIIANPPWSSDKQFDKEKLEEAGYTFFNGQQDIYALFIDICLRIIKPGGYIALILPDSIFSSENTTLRKHIAEETRLKVIARLGEKLFPGINRAASVLVLQNSLPDKSSMTKCFRLSTQQRRDILGGKSDLLSVYQDSFHTIYQKRFVENAGYLFDVDTKQNEESLLNKIEFSSICWTKQFRFSRGVEIGKNGIVIKCPSCRTAQTFPKVQHGEGKKMCIACNDDVPITQSYTEKIILDHRCRGSQRIYAGENVRRYSISGCKYIKLGVEGIDYKPPGIYASPKLLVRKTGLGINACIDYENTYITQTVYSCSALPPTDISLAYYMGVLNSRVLFYYYLKRYGENEWKSHPYLTKDILFSLPIPAVRADNRTVCEEIAHFSAKLQTQYSRADDIRLEWIVARLYQLDNSELTLLINNINQLPDLGAINHMKMSQEELRQIERAEYVPIYWQQN